MKVTEERMAQRIPAMLMSLLMDLHLSHLLVRIEMDPANVATRPVRKSIMTPSVRRFEERSPVPRYYGPDLATADSGY